MKKPVFIKQEIFCCGRYQLGYTGIFWPEEGTSQLVTISIQRSKTPSSALLRKRTWVVHTYPSVMTTFDLFPQSTGGLGHRSQITEGPEWKAEPAMLLQSDVLSFFLLSTKPCQFQQDDDDDHQVLSELSHCILQIKLQQRTCKKVYKSSLILFVIQQALPGLQGPANRLSPQRRQKNSHLKTQCPCI
jgi:hypothetical protein